MKNIKKAFMVVLYILSIVVALGVVMKYSEKGTISEGNGGPGCVYSGYYNNYCVDLMSGCDSGEYKTVFNRHSETYDFKSAGTYAAHGSCKGGAGCTTPLTFDLTSAGCAE